VAETVARQKERKERLEDILVVDCDVHVHESPKELAPYCDMPWRKALENIADVEEYYLDIPGAWCTPPSRCARSSRRSTWT
jgi:hypothetical protein